MKRLIDYEIWDEMPELFSPDNLNQENRKHFWGGVERELGVGAKISNERKETIDLGTRELRYKLGMGKGLDQRSFLLIQIPMKGKRIIDLDQSPVMITHPGLPSSPNSGKEKTGIVGSGNTPL